MNSSTIELQVTPSASELYAVIDVLVAVGLDLERRDDRSAGAARTGEPLTREREGLGIALCMLGQLIARQSAASTRNTSAAGLPNGTGAKGDRYEEAGSGILLHRISEEHRDR